MEKEYSDRKTNSSNTKHSFGSGLLGKGDKHKEIASWLDGDMIIIGPTEKTDIHDVLRKQSLPKKKKRKTKKGKSKYEDFRGDGGKIDYNLAYRKKRGGPEFSTLSKEEKKRVVFEKGTKIMYLQCPVCYGVRPLVVKLDKDGMPLKKHEDGIEYKMVDGVLQRRFSGPGDDFLPLMTKFTYGCYGQYVKVEDSMAINVLKRIDHDLYNDFKKVLERSLFKFQ